MQVLAPGYWIRRWIHRRIPQADESDLDRTNVFVFPTREGILFGILLIISLLTGINYQNSLIYLFTFILGTAFFGTIMQTFQNLAHVRATLVTVGQAPVGSSLPVTFRLVAVDDSDRSSLSLSVGESAVQELDVKGQEGALATLELPARQRGTVAVPTVRIETVFPFGLIRAWSFLRPARTGIATPRPVEPPAAYSASSEPGEEAENRFVRGADETYLRPYRKGDSLQRVQWKRYARTGQMVVADWEEPASDPLWIAWDDYPGVDTELRLSYMAWRVEQLSATRQPYGLVLPGKVSDPGEGSDHRLRCLRELGLFGTGSENTRRNDHGKA